MLESRTVLVVDDHHEIVQLVKTIIYLEGYTVIHGCSGENALFVNENHPFPIHALVTDVRMGAGMNGCDLASAMRASRPDIRVIYMSAYADDPRVEAETRAGEADFLSKPFSPSDLLGKLARACAAIPASAR